jgi:membrane protein DedA with SNARE-associated domain
MNELVDVLVRYGYLVVFGWVFAEQIGLPIPAMPVLLAAGAMAGTGRLSFVLVLVLAGIASLVSDVIWYWIGRLGGGRVLGFLCRISLEPDSCVRRTEETFSRRGARSLLIAKFVPGYSTAAPPLAGIVRMRFARFVVFGWLFSQQLELVASYAMRLGGWLVALLAAAFAAYIAWKYIARQRFLRRIRIARITPEELKAKLDGGEDVMVVDVRHRVEFESEPAIIPGALHLMIEELEARQHEVPRDRDIVLYCT